MGGTDFRVDDDGCRRLAKIAAIVDSGATMTDILHFLIARESDEGEGAWARSCGFSEWRKRYRC